MKNNPVTEDELKAKAVALRVTPELIESAIQAEFYFTGLQGALGGGTTPTQDETVALGLLTFCTLVLKNGFTVVGTSACASPENFNADIGRRVAREKAIEQMWPLLGFELKSRLAEGRI